jgi:hypothetical protein
MHQVTRKRLLAAVLMTALAVATSAGISTASQRPGTSMEAAASSAVFCAGSQDADGRYVARDPRSSC